MRESSSNTMTWWWSLRISCRASPSTTEEEEVLKREKEATKGQGLKSLLSPTIYRRAKGGWPALGDPIS